MSGKWSGGIRARRTRPAACRATMQWRAVVYSSTVVLVLSQSGTPNVRLKLLHTPVGVLAVHLLPVSPTGPHGAVPMAPGVCPSCPLGVSPCAVTHVSAKRCTAGQEPASRLMPLVPSRLTRIQPGRQPPPSLVAAAGTGVLHRCSPTDWYQGHTTAQGSAGAAHTLNPPPVPPARCRHVARACVGLGVAGLSRRNQRVLSPHPPAVPRPPAGAQLQLQHLPILSPFSNLSQTDELVLMGAAAPATVPPACACCCACCDSSWPARCWA